MNKACRTSNCANLYRGLTEICIDRLSNLTFVIFIIFFMINVPLQTFAVESDQIKSFNIPAQDLQSALIQFSKQSGIQLLYPTEITAGIKTKGVQGKFASREALGLLLSKTNLVYKFTASNTVTVQKSKGLLESNGKSALRIDPIVVSATGSKELLSSVPGSLTIIDSVDIQRQEEVSKSLADILAKSAPGFGPSSLTRTNTAQTLRGRSILVLIDGVPQNTSRSVSRDLFNIDPSAIDHSLP